jgi:hypothetical protein
VWNILKLKIISYFDSTYKSIYDAITTIPDTIKVFVRHTSDIHDLNTIYILTSDELISLILFNAYNSDVKNIRDDIIKATYNQYVNKLNLIYSIISCNNSYRSTKYEHSFDVTYT